VSDYSKANVNHTNAKTDQVSSKTLWVYYLSGRLCV
jgi:hypothetical protein